MANDEWPLEVWTASPPRDTGDVYQRVKGSGQATKKKASISGGLLRQGIFLVVG